MLLLYTYYLPELVMQCYIFYLTFTYMKKKIRKNLRGTAPIHNYHQCFIFWIQFPATVFFDPLRPLAAWFLFLFTRVERDGLILIMALDCNTLQCILGDRTARFTFIMVLTSAMQCIR